MLPAWYCTSTSYLLILQIHAGTAYSPGCPTTVRGVEVNTFLGYWTIPAWSANLSVTYYWSGEHSKPCLPSLDLQTLRSGAVLQARAGQCPSQHSYRGWLPLSKIIFMLTFNNFQGCDR